MPRPKLAERDPLAAYYDYGMRLRFGRRKVRALKMVRGRMGVKLFPAFDFQDYCTRCGCRRRDVEEIGRELYALRRRHDEKWLAGEDTRSERVRFHELAPKFDVPCRCGGRIQTFIGTSGEQLLNPTWCLGGHIGYFGHVREVLC